MENTKNKSAPEIAQIDIKYASWLIRHVKILNNEKYALFQKELKNLVSKAELEYVQHATSSVFEAILDVLFIAHAAPSL